MDTKMQMPSMPSIVFYNSTKEAGPAVPSAEQATREVYAHDFATGMLTHVWNKQTSQWDIHELIPVSDDEDDDE